MRSPRFCLLALSSSILLSLLLSPLLSQADAISPERRDLRAGEALLQRIPVSGGPDFVQQPVEAPTGDRTGWVLQQTVSNVLTGVSFADPLNGFASAELGAVYHTTNGGASWTTAMNVGFPYYWYGVHAFSAQTAVVAGFQNQSGAGILRWTDDGGATWSPDVVLDPANWLLNIRFADSMHGIAYGYQGYVYVTTNGGRTAADWTKIQADPTGGWFAGNFTFDAALRAWVTGIQLCNSTDGGLTWSSRHSVDNVFDGGVSFADGILGWTGGGQISAPVSGWVHRSSDGGATWSGRVLQTNYPIRVVQVFDLFHGFAAGGTRFNNAGGGIWESLDGGNSWNLDQDTGAEMSAIDWEPLVSDSADVWCVGFLPSFQGVIYKKRIAWLRPDAVPEPGVTATAVPTIAAVPNPFQRATEIRLSTGRRAAIVDLSGRRVRMLEAPDGTVVWDGRDEQGREVPAGVYLVTTEGKGGATVRLIRSR
ncbi:MAG: hypothetical protein ACE15D_01000 [Candidatus Eisenbacteria bacterium]|nr:hypothetical protein [Candidatus Eisenbacteria bacterium]